MIGPSNVGSGNSNSDSQTFLAILLTGRRPCLVETLVRSPQRYESGVRDCARPRRRTLRTVTMSSKSSVSQAANSVTQVLMADTLAKIRRSLAPGFSRLASLHAPRTFSKVVTERVIRTFQSTQKVQDESASADPLTLKPFFDAGSKNVRRLCRAQRQNVGYNVANLLACEMNIDRSLSLKRISATQG